MTRHDAGMPPAAKCRRPAARQHRVWHPHHPFLRRFPAMKRSTFWIAAAIVVVAFGGAAIFLPSILRLAGLHPHYAGRTFDLAGRRALIIATNHGILGDTGKPTGVYASEMTSALLRIPGRRHGGRCRERGRRRHTRRAHVHEMAARHALRSALRGRRGLQGQGRGVGGHRQPRCRLLRPRLPRGRLGRLLGTSGRRSRSERRSPKPGRRM